MSVPNFSSLAGLEVAEKFVVVGWWWVEHLTTVQSMAIFIAIYRLASISRVFRHIVVLVSHCGGKF